MVILLGEESKFAYSVCVTAEPVELGLYHDTSFGESDGLQQISDSVSNSRRP